MKTARYLAIDAGVVQGMVLAGVPVRDLSEDEWEALPPHVQQDVDGSGWWRKTKPPSDTPDAAPEPTAKKKGGD